jgi:hypothetical protein
MEAVAVKSEELVKVETFKQIIDTAPGIIQKNEISVNKAVEAGNNFLLKIQASGMNEALDMEANNLLVKIKKTHEKIQEGRKPITGLFDSVKKIFTGYEAKIDPKGSDNVYGQIQKLRNDFATKKALEQKQREEEARRKQAIEQEKINIKSDVVLKLKQYFIAYLGAQQKVLLTMFENIQLDTFDASSQLIDSFSVVYPVAYQEAFKAQIYKVYLTDAEVQEIISSAKKANFEAFLIEYRDTLRALKNSCIEKLPSKKKELEVIAQAGEDERARLQAEAERRAKEEQDNIAAFEAQKSTEAATQAETHKQVAQANSLFDMQASFAQPESNAQVREGYEITITNPAGYLQIVAFYFEKEGLKKGIDELEKKSLGQMKKFAEDYAKKYGEKITNPYIKYNEVFKAVTKKA